MIKINNWSTCAAIRDPFVAPECRGVALQGDVTDHPRLGAGFVHTSRIESYRGRVVKTASGSEYLLGRVDPKFRRWLHEHRPAWDWRHPLTIIETGSHTQ